MTADTDRPATHPATFLKRHPLVIGIALMFLLTWPIGLANSGVLPFHVPFAVYIVFGWGVSIAALVMTGLTQGRGAVVGLLKRFLVWRVGWRWYAVALLLFPAINLIAVFLDAALSGFPPDYSTAYAHQIFGPSANLLLYVVPFLLFDAITNGEELGWRGYVLPRLQARHGALAASLILGLVWGVWHLPRFFAPDNTASFVQLMVETVAKAVLYTWLYNGTRGSLLLVTLFHAAGNTAGVMLPAGNTITGDNTGVAFLSMTLLVTAAMAVTIMTMSMAVPMEPDNVRGGRGIGKG